jgi:carboxymethylenebutenolidase
VRADVRAAISHLEEAGIRQIFVLGFCFGGRAAFMQASQPGIAGVVGFYGVPTRGEKGQTPVDEARAGLVQAPVLALYGGADEAITPADRDAYDAALASASSTRALSTRARRTASSIARWPSTPRHVRTPGSASFAS